MKIKIRKNRGSIMKKWVKVVTIIAIIFTLYSILAIPATFYTLAYLDADNYIKLANTYKIAEDVENPPISHADMQSLRLVEEEFISDSEESDNGTYIYYRAKNKLKLNAWNKISFTSKITVFVEDFYSGELIDKYQGKRKLNFVFEDFKWKVESVEVIE